MTRTCDVQANVRKYVVYVHVSGTILYILSV